MDDDDSSIISSVNTIPVQLYPIFKLIDENGHEDYNIISLFNIEILQKILEKMLEDEKILSGPACETIEKMLSLLIPHIQKSDLHEIFEQLCSDTEFNEFIIEEFELFKDEDDSFKDEDDNFKDEDVVNVLREANDEDVVNVVREADDEDNLQNILDYNYTFDELFSIVRYIIGY